jgi:Root hair defective 3 GTP-binding protein (RHD3)
MNVMVMDVEGTDGRERGEDQASIYFQSLLFVYSLMLLLGL